MHLIRYFLLRSTITKTIMTRKIAPIVPPTIPPIFDSTSGM
jgi:hypothetical protein